MPLRLLAPADVPTQVFEEHKGWPLFNPGLEADPPPSVRALRERVKAAEAPSRRQSGAHARRDRRDREYAGLAGG